MGMGLRLAAFGRRSSAIRGRTKTKRKNCKAKIFNSIGKKNRKTQKVSDGLGNIKVMITKLEIKTEKEIALVDIRQQDSPIFSLELLLPNRLD